ncbi:uncharacterized protein BDR25DRAFT_374284 [Lindgomyces ingoldianus]|uniref:Uncharacterized protein n=1 Tax=Lindgomyces ingoldianus TaxID=673940 RepID=A0ACB6QM41_9PLEO|nr:uncharacterized protein BDR25DRAFT_374284 [Lindgomyces ingoldianus]KAF2467970.1 hypothetical protein BDR25DRAFT_374284 [Lindgomyces ingoldianus]
MSTFQRILSLGFIPILALLALQFYSPEAFQSFQDVMYPYQNLDVPFQWRRPRIVQLKTVLAGDMPNQQESIQIQFREFREKYGSKKPLISMFDQTVASSYPILLGGPRIIPDANIDISLAPLTLESNDTYPFCVGKAPQQRGQQSVLRLMLSAPLRSQDLVLPTPEELKSRDDALVIASLVVIEPEDVPNLVVPVNARVTKFVPYDLLLLLLTSNIRRTFLFQMADTGQSNIAFELEGPWLCPGLAKTKLIRMPLCSGQWSESTLVSASLAHRRYG